MSSITVHIPDAIKSSAQRQAKKDGVTITFIITQALQAYNDGKMKFGLLNADDEITASFDVSTMEGKKAALASFEAIK
ncbi:hypothetical protein COW94_05185 [Candidatus Peregrinibacteria bacterium CG22_combo_CG10-13_8_21_14_all_44_10]|nr:MAG: hypothetical protein AUK45_05100 [Candidatus Peregrinibacteria bacterium CG2_30_44_17]PIP65796.1 MAG: hypothetical protein COW94_05185 [Candidatus Peregrinibacteria bacterium CG22_combo_CG10-13_8_21_14_all_44_10]PIS03645.1 MAG: hypothetical protein COT83_04925 [Candidatus Peregrinibacteria bacterium CG10_big_fil_rev_8_21_14_0_10_44_7]PIX80147.1 MAG: hypothetical protein COZ35_01710 [Candidatus Peregrinibacteria bacterium CG_4_10_14_3_um_filter_44_21]PJB88777.1 MAG: hypothetical protein 